MNPSRRPTDEIDFEVGLGMGVNVAVAEPNDAVPNHTPGNSPTDGDEGPVSYLVKFESNVTPAAAEAVLGRLSPPDEGIILAGKGAVIVRAGRSFVEAADRAECVAFVSVVRTTHWEPTRHRVPAVPDSRC